MLGPKAWLSPEGKQDMPLALDDLVPLHRPAAIAADIPVPQAVAGVLHVTNLYMQVGTCNRE